MQKKIELNIIKDVLVRVYQYTPKQRKQSIGFFCKSHEQALPIMFLFSMEDLCSANESTKCKKKQQVWILVAKSLR